MKEENRTAIKAGKGYLIYNVIIQGITFLSLPIFNRLLSPSELGEYSKITSWINILIIVFTLDLGSSFLNAKNDFTDKELQEYTSSILLFGSGLTGIFLIFYIIFPAIYVHFFKIESKYICLILLYLLFHPAIAVNSYKYQAKLEYKKYIVLNLSFNILTVFGSLLCTLSANDRLAGRFFSTYGISFLFAVLVYIFSLLNGKIVFKLRYIKYTLPIAVPYAFHFLCGTILNMSDRIMISDICGLDFNALYSVACAFFTISSLLWMSFNNAYSPWVFERLNKKDDGLVRSTSQTALLIYGMILLCLCMFAPEGLYIWGGKKYMIASPAVPPVLIGNLFFAAYTFYINIESYYKKQIYIAFGTFGAALINILLNGIFLSKYGYVVAAYTTLIGYFLLLLFHFIIYRLVIKRNVYDDKIVFLSVILFAGAMELTLFIQNYIWIRAVLFILLMIFSFYLTYKTLKKYGIRIKDIGIGNKV